MEVRGVCLIICLSHALPVQSFPPDPNCHLPTLGPGKTITWTQEMQIIPEPVRNFHSRNMMAKHSTPDIFAPNLEFLLDRAE